MGLGIGNVFSPLMIIAMSEVPHRDAGLASGIVNVSQQVAGALGLALLATVATSHSAALSVAGHPATASLAGGYHLAYEFGAGALVVALILVVTVLRKHVPRLDLAQVPNPQSAPVVTNRDDLEVNVEIPA